MNDPYATISRVAELLEGLEAELRRIDASLAAVRDDLDPRVLRYRVARAHASVRDVIREAIHALTDRELAEAYRRVQGDLRIEADVERDLYDDDDYEAELLN